MANRTTGSPVTRATETSARSNAGVSTRAPFGASPESEVSSAAGLVSSRSLRHGPLRQLVQ